MTRRLTLYTAGKMSEIDDWNAPMFLEYELKLWLAGFNVINPTRIDLEAGFDPRGYTGFEKDLGFDRREVLKRDYVAICERADGIALLPGWEDSSGALSERAVGLALPIPVCEVEEWLLPGNDWWVEQVERWERGN